MKIRLVAALKAIEFKGFKLSVADRAYLRRWADDYADDPIWEEILADARDYDQLPRQSMHSQLIEYALRVRRMAESIKSGDDPDLRERQERRVKLLSLAEKADDLARYYREAEKYSGIAMFYQRFLVMPVMSEQEAVPRVEPPFLRVQQLRELHEREAQLLRQRAGREPRPMIHLSRQDRGKGRRGLRQVRAFIELMTYFMENEICGKRHLYAVALLTDMAFPGHDVDAEYVRTTLRSDYPRRALRVSKNRELNPKKA
jgi:hypothetical protein